MRLIISALICFVLCSSAEAANVISATVTVTDVTGTANGDTITVNGTLRLWTNNVAGNPALQIQTTNSIGWAATNLYNQFAAYPASGVVLFRSSTTGIILQGAPGAFLTVTISAGWGTVVYATNSTTSATVVRVPYTVEAAAQQTNIVSGLVNALSANVVTNILNESADALASIVGLTNSQVPTGRKRFTSTTGEWYGYVTNSPKISGYGYGITNGVFWTNKFTDPTLTNGINYGTAFSSPGSGSGSLQLGGTASAANTAATAVGDTASASGNVSSAFGYGSVASGDSSAALGVASATGDGSTAIGASAEASDLHASAFGSAAVAAFESSTAIGYGATTTVESQVRLGTSIQHVSIPGPLSAMGNTELTWTRYPNSGLATGNNAGVVVGTNTFIEVSGPGAAFAINGIAGGRDGKFLIILNQTSFNMTIAHESGVDATAANRIITMTGADRATTGNGAAMLIYSGSASRWILINLDP